MKIKSIIVMVSLLVLGIATFAGNGDGRIKLSYTFLDEQGNLSANHSTYNYYEGLGLSFQDFRYNFSNGIRLYGNLNNITLNNRNLFFGVDKPGIFGFRVSNNQYRRIYDFDGGVTTRRHSTSAKAWVYPHQYVKVYAEGNHIGRSGAMQPLFDLAGAAPSTNVDYSRMLLRGGVRLAHDGYLFGAEYESGNYSDDINADRDQSLSRLQLTAMAPVPRFERLILSGGYIHFENEYDFADFGIESDRGWGGFLLKLPENFQLRYNFIFDRTASDSDLVETDNITNAGYLSYSRPRMGSITFGYRHYINDDLEDELTANSIYLACWLMIIENLDIRARYGNRMEEMQDGTRLLGDENRHWAMLTARYRFPGTGSLSLGINGKTRKNDQLESEADYIRTTLDGVLNLKCGDIAAGYSYSNGEFTNINQTFEFVDHLLYGDFLLNEYRGIKPSIGAVYYRSQRDVDVEHFNIRLKIKYNLKDEYIFGIDYNVFNFDDFLVRDQYYTSNIVEISVIKLISY